MSSFRTPVPIQQSPLAIHHQNRLLCIGSCFAKHIGRRLKQLKFSTALNPFGILYNPVSIANALNRLLDGPAYQADDLFEHLGCWHSFDHHGSFSQPKQKDALQQINDRLTKGQKFLKQADVLLLTLGTAHVFEQNTNGQIVANCHKVPGQQFSRRRLSTEEIVNALRGPLLKYHQLLPHAQCILSVSPVRHLRDGLVENQRSKAALVLALAQLSEEFDFIHYYPAYELLLDDLRDYRFYDRDMAHPSEAAIDYIWDHFQQCFFREGTQHLVAKIQAIVKASQHRPFYPQSEAHQVFVRQQLKKMEVLEAEYSFLDFSLEKEVFTKPG